MHRLVHFVSAFILLACRGVDGGASPKKSPDARAPASKKGVDPRKAEPPPALLSDITQIVAAVPEAVCAFDSAGRVYCWGEWTRQGERNELLSTPTRVQDLPPIRQLAPFDSSLAVSEDGRLFEWKLATDARILRGRDAGIAVPEGVRLRPDGRLRSVAVGALPTNDGPTNLAAIVQATHPDHEDSFQCAIETSGRVRCAESWPSSSAAALRTFHLPARVASVGGHGSGGDFIVVLEDGRTAVWGPQLEVELRNAPTVRQASRMYGHTCGVDPQGVVHCWWPQSYARTPEDSVPKPVRGAGPARSVVALPLGGCAIQRDGTIKCWGENVHGECGTGSNDPSILEPSGVLAPTEQG